VEAVLGTIWRKTEFLGFSWLFGCAYVIYCGW